MSFDLHEAYAKNLPNSPSSLGALDAHGRKELWAALALRHTEGLGARSCKRLLDRFNSAYLAIAGIKDWPKLGLSEDKIAAFKSGSWRTTAKIEWDASRNLHGTILLWTDPRYPKLLRQLIDAPVRLYCLGDLSLLANPCVGIVGTRACTKEGMEAAINLSTGLSASGLTVVSGMAIGVDRHAHAAAVDLPGSTIGVLGAGLDVDYPTLNHDIRQRVAQKGLLISEYAPGTKPGSKHFPVRNRIISGLSLGIVVVEAALRSGSLITARLALEQNRTVYAVPGRLGIKQTQGCQELIRQGAQPVFSFQDILLDLAQELKVLPEVARGKAKPEPASLSKVQSEPESKDNSDSISLSKDKPDSISSSKVQPEFESKWDSSVTPIEFAAVQAALSPPVNGPAVFVQDSWEKSSGKTSLVPVNPPAPLPPIVVKPPNSKQKPRFKDNSFEADSLEYKILTSLASKVLDIDTLGESLQVNPGELSATLTILEVRGLIKQDSKMCYGLV